MKRILVLTLLAFMFASMSFAETVDTYMTANTVSFNTAAKVITFNSVAKSVFVLNCDNSDAAVHVSYTGLGWTAYRDTYVNPVLCVDNTSTTQSVVVLNPGESISINISTGIIGVISGGSGTITYVATGDRSQL